ncbi:MAG: peptidylprolyl isomerase [Cyclobacteriaceae bacterium]|jgi:cyclophilin family peptidyl-prolyl cis-trans isomerase/HEAT repeat protein
MKLHKFLFGLSIALVPAGCSTPTNKFSDSTIAAIADFQDHRQTDSLVRQLLNTNSIYRIEAAKALASIQDSTASLQLGTMLLEDPIKQARMAAAFALGQTSGTASVNALIPAMEDINSEVVAEVLEAIGKTIQPTDLPLLNKFKPKDSIQQAGQAWGFYWVGLRGIADDKIVSKQLEFLKQNYSTQIRLAAAHFFNRGTKFTIGTGDELIAAATNDPSAYVRMAASAGLRKLDSTKVIPVLLSILKSEADYRVRVSAARSLTNWSNSQTLGGIIRALRDSSEHVGIAAAESIKPIPAFGPALQEVAESTKSNRIKTNLYKTLLKIQPDSVLVKRIIASYQASTNDYERAALIGALANSPASYQFIADEFLRATSLVVKTNAAQTLVMVSKNGNFDQKSKATLLAIYREAILGGDPGVIAIITAALVDPTSDYKNMGVDFGFLKEAKNKLMLPKDIEALQPLEEAIAYFEGKEKPKAPQNQFNHPIDWKLVKTIKKNQRVKIETTKGAIVLALLVEEAPGSVANFVELVSKKYFNDKFFHRVVPNFVIQTGCNRGDGFGSEDYSMRSEFSTRRYKEGSVGMASAGKDTEGTQWFITHSPTPHLNGRYTIFAEVVAGMEVVHAIQVGDQIKTISLL